MTAGKTKITKIPERVPKIVELHLEDAAKKDYYRYGLAVIEDRAIFGDDGLKPVARRCLWSAYKMGLHNNVKGDKAAKLVGTCMGSYHPHGDCLRGDTLVPLLNGKLVTIKSLVEKGSKSKWILAFNQKTCKLEPAKAYNWKIGHTTRDLFRVHLTNGDILECTGNHPFLTQDSGWVKASELIAGQSLIGGLIEIDTDYVKVFRGSVQIYKKDKSSTQLTFESCLFVNRVEHVVLDVAEDFYDFTVDNHHNMIVASPSSYGKSKFAFCVVHNTSIFGALVTAVKSPVAMFDGEGNWGTMTDGPAAMRYINLKLSRYSDLVFFDRFYIPTIEFVPNYDGSTVEPLLLPTLLPNALLNGNFGIAPGVNTRSPSYSPASVIKVLKEVVASGTACTPRQCLQLEFTTKYGGRVVINKAVRTDLLKFYKTGQGSVKFISSHSEVKNNSIRFDAFAPIVNFERAIILAEAVKGVASSRDDSDKTDKYQVARVVTFVKSLNGVALIAAIKSVEEKFSAVQRFSAQITKRFKKKNGTAGAKLQPTSIPHMIDEWIETRLELERKACTYWIERRAVEIADLELLRLAVKMRDFIIKALDRKGTDEELAEYISKGLKITIVQANRILDLKVRQLRALEEAKLVAKIKVLDAETKDYERRRKNPSAYVLTHLDELAKALKFD